MKCLILLFCWLILLAVCWPLALVALVLAPLVWIISIPFRVVFACVEGVLGLALGLLLLPARLLRKL